MLELIGLTLFSLASLSLIFCGGFVCLCGGLWCFCRCLKGTAKRSGTIVSCLCWLFTLFTLLFLVGMVTYSVVNRTLHAPVYLPDVHALPPPRKPLGNGTLIINGVIIQSDGSMSVPVRSPPPPRPPLVPLPREITCPDICWPEEEEEAERISDPVSCRFNVSAIRKLG
jgi:hypothetical protein